MFSHLELQIDNIHIKLGNNFGTKMASEVFKKVILYGQKWGYSSQNCLFSAFEVWYELPISENNTPSCGIKFHYYISALPLQRNVHASIYILKLPPMQGTIIEIWDFIWVHLGLRHKRVLEELMLLKSGVMVEVYKNLTDL